MVTPVTVFSLKTENRNKPETLYCQLWTWWKNVGIAEELYPNCAKLCATIQVLLERCVDKGETCLLVTWKAWS